MKKTIITILMVFTSLLIYADDIDSTLENKYLAIADTWGNIKYLHPKASEDDIDWNSAFVEAIKEFDKDSSDLSLKHRISTMLEKLNDPHTFLITEYEDDVRNPKNSLQIKDNIIHLQLNDYSSDKKAEQNSLIQEALKLTLSEKGIIIDIRNYSSDLIDLNDIIDRNNIVENLIIGEIDMPFYKSLSYNGFPGDNLSYVYTKNSIVNNFGSYPIDGTREDEEIPVVFIINDRIIIPQKLIALGLNNKAQFLSTKKHVHDFNKTFTNDYFEVKLHLVYWYLNGKTYYSFVNKFVDNSQTDSNYYNIALEMLSNKEIAKLRTIQDFTRNKKESFKSLNGFPTKEERILALAKLYFVINNFNPHQKFMRFSPEDNFKAILPEIISASDSLQYNLALAKFVSNLCDSHGFVNGKAFRKHFYSAGFPFDIQRIDDKFYISKLYNENHANENILNLGDEIVSMNGEVPIDLFNKTKIYFSSSNSNYENKRVCNVILNGKLEEKCLFSITNAESTREIHLNRIKTSEKYKFMKSHQDTVKMLENDIAYVNLNLLQVDKIQKMFNEIKNNKAVIFDMRGYPNHIIWDLAPYLTNGEKVLHSQFATPVFEYFPFETQNCGYILEQAYTLGIGKKITTPIVILMNEKTQSQAEYTCLIIKELTGATLIGRQTAGSDGDVTYFKLPGNVIIGFTGSDPQDARGVSHQGIGLIPDITVSRTLEGIKSGKDEELEKAIEFLKERIDFKN